MAAPTNAEIAYQQSGLLDRWTLYTTQLRDWLGGTATGGPNGDGAYPLQDATGLTFMVPCPAANSAKVTELTDPLTGLQTAVDASVTAAQAAQAAAEQARDIAMTYRDAATQSSGDASMYATNSANSAADSLTYKNAASASATNAATSATAAATSETNAAASATAAAASATDADNDAVAAAQSAQASDASATQAAQSAAGKLAWFGVWDISSGTLPAAPSNPGFYWISGTATIGTEEYADGDALVWGAEGVWHHIDNQQTVASVAGLMGTISVTQLQTALMLGTAAYQNVEAFATAAQGAAADAAMPLAGGTFTGSVIFPGGVGSTLSVGSDGFSCVIKVQPGTNDRLWLYTNLVYCNGSVQAVGNVTAAGLNLGAASVVSRTDVSRHVNLYNSQYGLSITSGSLNFVSPNGSGQYHVINGVIVGQFTGSGFSSMSVTDTSDARFKENITPLDDATRIIDALRPVRFFNKGTKRDEMGFVAQEVQIVEPSLVVEHGEGADAHLTLAYQRIVAPLVAEVQRLRRRVAALERAA